MAPPLDKYLPPGCKFLPPEALSECPVKRQRRQQLRRRGTSPVQHSQPWSSASSPPSQAGSPLCSPPRSPHAISPRGRTPSKSRSHTPKKTPRAASKSRSLSPATSYSCCRNGPCGPCSPPRISRECSPSARYSCPRTPKPRSLAQSLPSPAGKVPRTPCSSPLHHRSTSVSPRSRPSLRVYHDKPWNRGESGDRHPDCTFEEIAYKNSPPPPCKPPLSSSELKALRMFTDPRERHHFHPHGVSVERPRPAVYCPPRGEIFTLFW